LQCWRMNTDNSTCDEMEPRFNRAVLPRFCNRDIPVLGQVSEPSLFNLDEELLPYRQVFNPRAEVRQTTPVKSPAFIPQLTPLSSLKNPLKSANSSKNGNSPCGCTSPSIDPEIKELIQDQNKQLQLLRNQVEKLLQYQETLKDSEVKEISHESTQTSFGYPKEEASNSNNRSPLSRQERTELTLTFRDLQLETIMEQPLSPQPSFVVNMQEYQNSVSDKAEDSLSDSCVSVMEHVQRLLAQTNISDKDRGILSDIRSEPRSVVGENPVRKVTMQRVQELGISFIKPAATNTQRSPVYYPSYKRGQPLDVRKETDQSVEMQQLAEKYLGKAAQFETRMLLDRSVRTSKSVEMSMSSQQYLERYGLHNDILD